MKRVTVKDANGKGLGVFALKNFRKGEVIFRSPMGKIVKKKDLNKLSRDDRIHTNEIDEETYYVQRSPERYVNHSCNPNAISKGRTILAFLKIRAGEEITFDYRIGAHDNWKLNCLCKSKNCSGTVIGDFFTISKRRQKMYLLYTQEFIQQKFFRSQKLPLRSTL